MQCSFRIAQMLSPAICIKRRDQSSHFWKWQYGWKRLLIPSQSSFLHSTTHKGRRLSQLKDQQISNSKQNESSLIDRKTDLSRFLIEVGTDPKEARYWMKSFLASVEPSKVFMVVSVQDDVMDCEMQLEMFASTISFLFRNSMCPLIVCGNESNKSSFQAVKDASVWKALRLSDMLEKHGTYARVLGPGSGIVLQGEVDKSPISQNSQLHISSDKIKHSLGTRHLPIVLSYGETPSGQLFAADPWEVTVEMSRLFQPMKVMLVNASGGFLNEQGQVIANINLPSDLATIDQKPWCTQEIVGKMVQINKLLLDLPSESSVVITSAYTMLRELFSYRGSGTFFRLTETIDKYSSLRGIDLDRLKKLLQRSFNKKLDDSYFDDISSQIHAIYLSESYSGVLIILKGKESDVPYLCKFAVTIKAQGQGTGDLLWDTLKQSEPCLFWRSNTNNSINSWYGISDPSSCSPLIKDAVSRPRSFLDVGNDEGFRSDDERKIS